MNATLYELAPGTGAIIAVYLVEVDKSGRVRQSNGQHDSSPEATPASENQLHRDSHRFRIVPDGGRGYFHYTRATAAAAIPGTEQSSRV
jgi:hypothetical protein